MIVKALPDICGSVFIMKAGKKLSDRKQGILFIIGAAFCFALMNLFVRLSEGVPLYEQCFFRNIVALIVSAAILAGSGGNFRPRSGNGKYVAMRAVSGSLGLICNFYAIDKLNISDASMLNKLSPFFAMIFSIWVVGEKAAVTDWIAIAAAFSGALLVIRPTQGMTGFPAFMVVLGGLGAGLAYTFVRKLSSRGEQKWLIVFYFSLFSCLIVVPFMVFMWVPMTAMQFISLTLAGTAATGGQICITSAYLKAPASEISVFDYTQVLFAALLGYAFLGQIPDLLSVFGYIIIITVAVVKWSYNICRHKA